jgi:hypothetical protein
MNIPIACILNTLLPLRGRLFTLGSEILTIALKAVALEAPSTSLPSALSGRP